MIIPSSKFRNLKYIIIGFLFTFLLSFCSSNNTTTKEEEKHRIILKTIYQTLDLLHPSSIDIDDHFSQKVYQKYFENLDHQKRFFMQKDIDNLSCYREKIDEDWINGDPKFFNITMDFFYQRIKDVENFCLKILKKPFDFNKKEVFIPGEYKYFYPKNKQKWMEEWRKYLKYLTIMEIVSPLNNPKENIWKNPKKDIWRNIFMNKEEQSRKKVEENIREYFRKLKIRKKKDWFSMYVNTITSQYDPHTIYFSPKEKENFDFNMSGEIEGIGVELKEDKGYATIVKIIVGGPAWKSKKIEIGDKIIRVASNPNSEYKNITGMLLDNSIRLIRGKKGSKVKLTIQKKDGSIEEVILIRDTIEKKEIFAKSVTLLDDNNKDKYGLIHLPEFYFNPENKNGRNAAKDMRRIIQELKKENIQGLIVDIRNNGGGSLDTVVEIAGLFLGKVPIVQVGLSDRKKKKILKNKDPQVLWEGPLVILVNELSASASEILASAIVDYKRGIIVGSYQTYGKGTVQTFYPLNKFFFFNEELGYLKFTISKFYRVNGSSTQLKGVNSDIVIPNNISCSLKIMEKDQPNSMIWDRIDSLSFPFWKKDRGYLEKIKLKSINRIKKHHKLMTMDKTIQLLEKRFLNNKYVSLNWKDFYYETLKIKKINKEFETLKNCFNVYGLRAFPPRYKIVSKYKLEQKEWINNLLKDFHIAECVNILRDFKEIS